MATAVDTKVNSPVFGGKTQKKHQYECGTVCERMKSAAVICDTPNRV